LHEERAQVTVSSLGDAPEDRTAVGAVLSRHQAETGTELAPAVKGLSDADCGDKAGYVEANLAVALARRTGRPVTFVATAEARDAEMAELLVYRRRLSDRPVALP